MVNTRVRRCDASKLEKRTDIPFLYKYLFVSIVNPLECRDVERAELSKAKKRPRHSLKVLWKEVHIQARPSLIRVRAQSHASITICARKTFPISLFHKFTKHTLKQSNPQDNVLVKSDSDSINQIHGICFVFM